MLSMLISMVDVEAFAHDIEVAGKTKNGEHLSFYLDYNPGHHDESTMKVMHHESLGIYIYVKPKSQCEKDYNDRMREKAETFRCRRYESIVNE